MARSRASRWRWAKASVALRDGVRGRTAVSATICFWTVNRLTCWPGFGLFIGFPASSGLSVISMKYSGERPTPGPSTSLKSRASAWYATSSYSRSFNGANASARRPVTLPSFKAPIGTETLRAGSPSLWNTSSIDATPWSSDAAIEIGTVSVGNARMSRPGSVTSTVGGASASARTRRTVASIPGRPFASASTTVNAMLDSTWMSVDQRRSPSGRRGTTMPLVNRKDADASGTFASNDHRARVPRRAETSGEPFVVSRRRV